VVECGVVLEYVQRLRELVDELQPKGRTAEVTKRWRQSHRGVGLRRRAARRCDAAAEKRGCESPVVAPAVLGECVMQRMYRAASNAKRVFAHVVVGLEVHEPHRRAQRAA
jgi:hypothetical protein